MLFIFPIGWPVFPIGLLIFPVGWHISFPIGWPNEQTTNALGLGLARQDRSGSAFYFRNLDVCPCWTILLLFQKTGFGK